MPVLRGSIKCAHFCTASIDVTLAVLAVAIASFSQIALATLREAPYDKLDIKETRWQEDFTLFKNRVHELERLYETVVTEAFATVRTLEGGVELLEIFHSLARSPKIYQVIFFPSICCV